MATSIERFIERQLGDLTAERDAALARAAAAEADRAALISDRIFATKDRSNGSPIWSACSGQSHCDHFETYEQAEAAVLARVRGEATNPEGR